MNKNVIRILIIGLVAIFIVMIINIDISKKPESIRKLSLREMDDYIIDLYVNFDEENIGNYSKQELVIISVMMYDAEINNGGLCQFFVNSSRIFAPIISDSLEQIKALKHKEQFDNFIKQNKLDVNNLNSFMSDDVDEFISQYERYSFDDFDMEYYELEQTENLSNLMLEYAENNYDKIFKD